MKYMLLIQQGDSPTPRDPEAWGRLSEEEQRAVYADYQALNQTPGVTPGTELAPPEAATTVRVTVVLPRCAGVMDEAGPSRPGDAGRRWPR